MERLACVDVAALPLQLLLQVHPDWRTRPVAVVEDDRPHARVLYVNARARQAGVRSGLRYTTALTIDRHLRAGAVSRSQIDAGIHMLADRLRRYSPRVEPSSDRPGIFWLDVSGFDRLHPALHAWAVDVRADLARVDMRSSIAVGFSRFGVYALAISRRDVVVCGSIEDERAAIRHVSISRLALDPDVRDRLFALGVNTVGDFLRLPADGIRARFGADVGALHQLATGTHVTPLVPAPPDAIHERLVDFDAPEYHVERVLFVVKRLLDELAAALARQALVVAELALHLTFDDRSTRLERVRPAAPTRDVAQLLTLVRLRLESLPHVCGEAGSRHHQGTADRQGLTMLRVVADVCPATADQQRLFAETRRDPAAANHALARLRAECGEQRVVRARLRDAHLPAARFTWEPIVCVPTRLRPRVVAARPLVRRIYSTPLPIDRTQLSAAARVEGPYVVSGGWWVGGDGRSVHRDYYFVHTTHGHVWWIYDDRRRQRLFLQGSVE